MNKSHVSTLLTIVGSIGVVATAVTAAKAAPKAVKLIEEEEDIQERELTKLEKVKIAAPVYIPAAFTAASTIACVVGANMLNKRHQASLTSAYAVLSQSYNEYKNKACELYGADANNQIQVEIARDCYEEEEPSEGEELFFDFNSMQYFTSTIDQVIQKTTMDDGLECYIISTPFDVPRKW